MQTIELNDVYHVGPACLSDGLHVHLNPRHGKIDDRKLYKGRFRPARALPFLVESGSRRYDAISVSPAVLWIVSDRFVEVLRGFTGWQTYPCKITGQDGKPVPGYHGLSIAGRCGPIDPQRGRALWAEISQPWSPPSYRVFPWFEPGSWDGSDLFSPGGTALTLITEAVKQALEKAELTNLHITELRFA